MTKMNNSALPCALAAIAGFTVCLAITSVTGRREAWDAGEYFTIGIPLMCAVIFAISYRFPHRSWRWVLCMAVGQGTAMALGGGSLSLWPLSIIAMTVVSLPQFITALIAGRIARKKLPPQGPAA